MITEEQFLQAAEDGDLSAVKQYIEEGSDIDVKDCNTTALMYASENGHLEVVKYLIEILMKLIIMIPVHLCLLHKKVILK